MSSPIFCCVSICNPESEKKPTENGVILRVVLAGINSQQGSKVVINDLATLVAGDEVAPLLLHLGGLEVLFLVQNINPGDIGSEGRHKVNVDLIINPGMVWWNKKQE